MIKDQSRYAATRGWGFARWLGMAQTPYDNDASFRQACYGCHTAAKSAHYAFTQPARLP